MYHGVPVVPGLHLAQAGPGDDWPGLTGAAQPSSERSDGPSESSGPLRSEGPALS